MFEGNGLIGDYVGGYSDWLKQGKKVLQPEKQSPAPISQSTPRRNNRQKLSYKETRELEGLPKTIEVLEAEVVLVEAKLADPELYRSDPEKLNQLNEKIEETQKTLEQSYQRWEELEARQAELQAGA